MLCLCYLLLRLVELLLLVHERFAKRCGTLLYPAKHSQAVLKCGNGLCVIIKTWHDNKAKYVALANDGIYIVLHIARKHLHLNNSCLAHYSGGQDNDAVIYARFKALAVVIG